MSQKVEAVVKNGGQIFSLESYLKACDTCPFLDECESYREAFGSSECLRDDYGRALLDFLKDSRKESWERTISDMLSPGWAKKIEGKIQGKGEENG